MTVDVEVLAGILRDAGRAEVWPHFRRLDDAMVRQKSEPSDLVTLADEAAERVISSEIRARWPDALVVGEEGVAADPELLRRSIGADLAIFVDPIDGTANFVAGVPAFAVMAAVVRGGEVVAGVVYDPAGDDWMIAERGGGTWLVRPDGGRSRQHFARAVPLQQMTGAGSVFYLPAEQRGAVLGNLAKIRMLANYRCAGHEYRIAASGNVHFLIYSKLMPWDHAAGTLMCEEAGAYVARLDGSRYLPEHHGGGLLVAPDAESWTALRREVFVA